MPFRTDHELNAEFLAKLMEEAAPEDWVPVKAVAGEWGYRFRLKQPSRPVEAVK